jgi:hypothetical protein
MNAPAVAARKKSERSAPTNTPGEIRVAYPYFHEKRVTNSAGVPFTYPPSSPKAGQPNPRYSATLMFPKLNADPGQCANYMFLWGLATEAARKMWPQNVDPATGQWVWPAGAQYAVKDGDVPFVSKQKPGQPLPTAEEIAKKNAWRRGYWIVEVENFLDPGPRIAKVANGTEVELPAKLVNGVEMYKSGDFGVANIHAYAYENNTFGINYGFDGFCFTREGEKIGQSGPRSAAQMFGGVAGMVPQSTALPGVVQASPAPLPSPAYAPGPMQVAQSGLDTLANLATMAAPVALPMPPQVQQFAPPAAPLAPMPPMPGAAPSNLPPLPVR